MDGQLRPSAPPRTSLDLYVAWQSHQGHTVDLAELREAGLEGLPLTERVFNAFPAFAAAAAGGFYGALHVTMEDGNLEDLHVADAVREATEEGHAVEIALARTLEAMTFPERVALYLSLFPDEEANFGTVGVDDDQVA